MADHVIKITISTTPGRVLDYEQIKDGVSQGDGTHAHGIKQNDTISWRCDDGDFAVLFKRNPLDIGVLSAQAGKDTRTVHIKVKHTGNLETDTYKYFAVVMDKGTPKAEDPDIIIDT